MSTKAESNISELSNSSFSRKPLLWYAVHTPLQRPAKYADQQFFTEEQRAELDKERTEVLNRRAVGTPNDGYNFAVFLTTKRTGARTSKIVDPLNGRIPPLTLEAQKAAATDREFRLALLRATETCKNQLPACAGGNYDPTPSPRLSEPPPRYNAINFGRINRHDGPEDGSLADRCLTGELPEFGSVRRQLPADRTTWARGKGGNATS